MNSSNPLYLLKLLQIGLNEKNKNLYKKAHKVWYFKIRFRILMAFQLKKISFGFCYSVDGNFVHLTGLFYLCFGGQ